MSPTPMGASGSPASRAFIGVVIVGEDARGAATSRASSAAIRGKNSFFDFHIVSLLLPPL